MRFNTLSACELAGVVAFAILAIIFGISGYGSFVANTNFNGALECYGRRDPAGAIERLQAVVNVYPDYPYPRELLAKIYVDADNFSEAERHYSELERATRGRSASIFIGRAAIHVRKADREAEEDVKKAYRDEAKEMYQHAQELAPGSAEALVGLGHIALREKDYAGAIKYFESAYSADEPLTVDSLVDLYLGKGMYYYGGPGGDFSSALAEVRKAYELRPTGTATLLNIGYLYSDLLVQPGLTREEFDHHFKDVEAYRRNLYQVMGPSTLEQQLLVETMVILSNALGITYTRFKEWDRARNSFDEAIGKINELYRLQEAFMKIDPSAPFINMAAMCMDRAEEEPSSLTDKETFRWTAATFWEQALKFTKDSKLKYLLLNNIACIEHARDPDKAIRYLTNAASENPSDYLAYRNLGIVYDKKEKNTTGALTNYKKSLLANPDQPDVRNRVDELSGIIGGEEEED